MYNDIRNFFVDMNMLNSLSGIEVLDVREEINSYLTSILRENEVIWSDDDFISTVTDGVVRTAPSTVPASTCGGLCYSGQIGQIAYLQLMNALTRSSMEQLLSCYHLDSEYVERSFTYMASNIRSKIIYYIEPLCELLSHKKHLSSTAIHALVDYVVYHERRHAEQHGAVVDDFIESLTSGTAIAPSDEEHFAQYAAQSWEDDADRCAIAAVRAKYHF